MVNLVFMTAQKWLWFYIFALIISNQLSGQFIGRAVELNIAPPMNWWDSYLYQTQNARPNGAGRLCVYFIKLYGTLSTTALQCHLD